MTTTTRTCTFVIAAMAVAAVACSTPQPQQPAASVATADVPAPGQTPPAAQAAQASPSEAGQPPAAQAAPPNAAAEPTQAAAPTPPQPKVAHLNAGQVLTVRTTRLLSTKTMKTGDAFSAILEDPITVDGWVVAAAGAKVDGRIVEADKGGRFKGKASLSIRLTRLTTSDGQKIDIVTSPLGSEAATNRGKDAVKVGVGAGAGAAVGAIAGGGKGAAFGALIGGGAGAAMRGDAAEIAAETVMAFTLRSPVTIHEKE